MHRDLRAMVRSPEDNVCHIAAAIVGAAVVGGGAAVYGANKQAKAAGQARDAQLQMYETTRGDLMPYNIGGQQAFAHANRMMMGSPSEQMAMLEGMPGYQFALTQGLKSVQNSASARGLGVSGAALKGAAGYATGLADQTFGAQINRLMQSATIGENAAAQTGAAGTAAGQGIANSLIQRGNAYAGGAAGVADAFGMGAIGYGMYGGFGGNGGGGFAGVSPLEIADLEGLY